MLESPRRDFLTTRPSRTREICKWFLFLEFKWGKKGKIKYIKENRKVVPDRTKAKREIPEGTDGTYRITDSVIAERCDSLSQVSCQYLLHA